MGITKQKYDAQQKKKAISMLKSFVKLIEAGSHSIEDFGTWFGLDGKLNLKVVVKEKES